MLNWDALFHVSVGLCVHSNIQMENDQADGRSDDPFVCGFCCDKHWFQLRMVFLSHLVNEDNVDNSSQCNKIPMYCSLVLQSRK